VGLAAAGCALFGAASSVAAGTLPTLTLAFNGKSVTVGGSMQSGAVNVATTLTGGKQGEAILVRFNPGVPFSDFDLASKAVGQHRGDLNYLSPYGSIVFAMQVGKGTTTAQTVLAPGNYFAINGQGNGKPPHAAFIVTQSASPATLPSPKATVSEIDFGFKGPTTLHVGELVRFENDGFVVHMNDWAQAKDMASAKKGAALLAAGKDNAAGRFFVNGGEFAGPMSSGGVVQEVVNLKPGAYVQACFMNTQDGREHTRLGMVRVFRVVK
jgi:hypothetical protein